jgi:hypothetical protein
MSAALTVICSAGEPSDVAAAEADDDGTAPDDETVGEQQDDPEEEGVSLKRVRHST